MDILDYLKRVFSIGKPCDLTNYIEKQMSNGILFEHRLSFMDLLDSRNLKFYKTDMSRKKNWLNFLNNKDDIEIIKGYKSIIIIDKNKIITILFDWSGLYELVRLFENIADDSMKRKLFIVKYDVEKCLSHLSKKFSEVISKFKGIVINGESLEIFNIIIPDKAIIINKVISIPKQDRIPINKIDIYVDPSCAITSVRLYGQHLNSDSNGWYCLGNLKFSPLSIDTINRLIEQIKCYQLQDCYWKPKNFKEWVKYNQSV